MLAETPGFVLIGVDARLISTAADEGMNMADGVALCEARLREDGAPELLIQAFRRHYQRLTSGHTGLIPESALSPVGDLPDLDRLPPLADRAHDAFARTLVVKLNGGLGTSMGLERAKSLLPVKKDLSFLDIIAGQTMALRRHEKIHLPLLFMNSFTTEADTHAALAPHRELLADQPDLDVSFVQNRVPKIRQDNLEPVRWPADPEKEWCPPGHGDLYIALVTTGLLERLLKQGYRYAFVSNADNLGATVDPRLLVYFAEQGAPMLMEVTDRTEADRKGGHLARHAGSHRLLLRESAQCPEEEAPSFQDIRRHRYFNTNSIWLNLELIRPFIESPDHLASIPLIVNRKSVDPRDKASPGVFQLETAMGSAISVFPGAAAIRVSRARFAPVKTTNDLLALWSDAYRITGEMHVVLDPSRAGGPPLVRLDPTYYGVIDDFRARFPHGAPSLIGCRSLAVEGDFVFGRDVVVTGDVTLSNTTGRQIRLADGTRLSG
jgi:UTP--glucose-1-phosphate uridylyltransferase